MLGARDHPWLLSLVGAWCLKTSQVFGWIGALCPSSCLFFVLVGARCWRSSLVFGWIGAWCLRTSQVFGWVVAVQYFVISVNNFPSLLLFMCCHVFFHHMGLDWPFGIFLFFMYDLVNPYISLFEF